MEVLLWIVIGLPTIALVAYLEDRRNNRKMNLIENLIQSKLKENGYIATNAIWYDSLYIATDLQKDKVVIIRYDEQGYKILNVQSIDAKLKNNHCIALKPQVADDSLQFKEALFYEFDFTGVNTIVPKPTFVNIPPASH